MKASRRRFLSLSTAAAVTGLAGCNSTTERTTTTTAPRTTTETQTTTTEDQLEQTHRVTELDRVTEELEQDTFTLNFLPADPDAAYAESNIFDEYSRTGSYTLNVKIDLDQADRQRHHYQMARKHPAVQEWINNIQDEEWRQQILENDPTISSINWETYTNEELSYEERMKQSDMWRFWYVFEEDRFGGVGSENNQFKAQALQETETQLGFDTFIWDYGIPGHGLVSAIEHPTRNPEETENQATYIIETDFTDAESQQIATWENSQYRHEELHPAREGVDRDLRTKGFYGRTAIGKDEVGFSETVRIPMNGSEQFIEFFRNPESSPAYDHLDPMTATAYIAEENINNSDVVGWVTLGTDSIELHV